MVICICKTIKPNCILLFYKNINRLIPTPNFIRKKYILNLYNINRNMMHGCYNRNDYNKVKYYFTNVFLRQHKEKMQETIYDFIDTYVLCQKCKNPETYYILQEKNDIAMKCNACPEISLIPINKKTLK